MSNHTITVSSELMKNYKQLAVMSPEAKFEALQTATGCSLLFSISSAGVFFVTEETPGQATGWLRTALSTAQIAKDYPGLSNITCKTFAVTQNSNDGRIGMAMVLNDGREDHLYLSFGNSDHDTSWLNHPNWVSYPFDDPHHHLARVVIVDLLISTASDGQYIVVDVLRDPNSPQKMIFRYYIDQNKTNNQAWQPHDLPIDVSGDIKTDRYASCLGRQKGARVDGLYTFGEIGSHPQFIYRPLYNVWNPDIPPNPARLNLPNHLFPDAMAACRNTDQSTDLYVSAQGGMYYFASSNQKDQAQAVLLMQNAMFTRVKKLFAFRSADQIVVWGLNGSNEIFYTACPIRQITTANAWSYPLPILTGVDMVSPYVNKIDNGNTFFAVADDKLQKAVQSPQSMTWKTQSITLPPQERTATAQKFSSYTTRIQVTDTNKQPLTNTQIQLSSLQRAGFYINNLYSVLDTTPIPVMTDAMGALVIVEPVTNLQATCLRVHSDDGAILSINPMDKPLQKLAQLNSSDRLASAVIPGRNGNTKPLIASTTSEQDRQTIVNAISSLTNAYQSLPADGSIRTQISRGATALDDLSHIPATNVASLRIGDNAPMARGLSAEMVDFGKAISVYAGDLVHYLDTVTDYVIHIVKEAGDEVWHFIAEVGGQMYQFVLDSVTKVISVFEYLFNALKTTLEDLIHYLQFFFEWDDFVRTKDVAKHLLLLYFDHLLDGLDSVKAELNDQIKDAKAYLDDWAHVKQDTWKTGVENNQHSLKYLQTLMDVGEAFTAPGMFLFQQFLDNLPSIRGKHEIAVAVDAKDDVLNRIVQALEDEGNAFTDVVNRIKSELLDNRLYESLSLGDLLQKLTAIGLDGFLNSAEVMTDLFIDLLVALARVIIKILDTPIWIPVLSDILADALGVEISFSMLDVILMVGAIPATLLYKGLKDAPPFSAQDGFSDKILAAKDVYALQAAFDGGNSRESLPRAALLSAAARGEAGKQASQFVPISLPPNAQKVIFIVGHCIGGLAALIGAVLTIPDALSEQEDTYEYGMALAVSSAVGGLAAGLSAILAQPYPIQQAVVAKLNTTLTGLTLLGKVVFKLAPHAVAKKRGNMKKSEKDSLTTKTKKIAAGYDAVIAFCSLAPTGYHFYELSQAPASSDRSEAFINEASNICIYLSRIGAFAVQMDKDPESKAVLAGVTSILIALYGGLQVGEVLTEAAAG